MVHHQPSVVAKDLCRRLQPWSIRIAIGRDETAPRLEALAKRTAGVDRLDAGVEHRGFGQFLGEERHKPPAAAVELHIAGFVDVNEIDLLRGRDIEPRLYVGLGREHLVGELVKRMQLRPRHLIGETSAHQPIPLCRQAPPIRRATCHIPEWISQRGRRPSAR